MADIQEDLKNDQTDNFAIKTLNNLCKSGKLTQEQSENYKKKWNFLQETITSGFQYQKSLLLRYQKQKNDITNEREQAKIEEQRQLAAQEHAEQLKQRLKKVEQQVEDREHKNDRYLAEVEELENECQLKKTRLEEKRTDALEKILPDKKNIESSIKNTLEDIEKKKQQFESETRTNNDLIEKTELLRKENDQLLLEKQSLLDEKMKIKDDPTRHKKGAEILGQAITLMQEDLQKILDDIAKKDKTLCEQDQDIQHKEQKKQEYDQSIDKYKKENEQASQDILKFQNEVFRIKEEQDQLRAEKVEFELELRDQSKRKKMEQEYQSKLKKMIDHDKKEARLEENQVKLLQDEIGELEMMIDKNNKEDEELRQLFDRQDEVKINLDEENKQIEFKKRTIQEETQEKQRRKQDMQKDIENFEQQITKQIEEEQTYQKQVKTLTAMRESMARKASSALAEVRETREELKIKELLILDLTKRHAEIELKLNSYKALYEEVKSSRNKYVNLIQNSSQDLAELKERIKIMQNELEILKNESQEKDRTLLDYKHILQLQIHKRDRIRAKLNKLEYSRKAKKEIVDQNINEIEKLNMIISSIEKDMCNLRRAYEQACESRNHTGIQLIDRNDELCILYEKANIEENVLRTGEMEVKRTEDEIRMIKIELNEVKRKIDVARKQILFVPQLADRVIQLENELKLEKTKEANLANDLENPENFSRYRDLKGEDPDEEALNAKISVLEERLNNKKEQLLEKELILDEITTLSEKLRKQALEDRQKTLELSEKVNDFQARLKDITRKMMATISELSMFQATGIKMQQECEELQKITELAKSRIQQELPPTPETEIEYLKMVRDQARYEQERGIRIQREALEKNFPPFATRTTAEHRVNAYIPDEIGIPKPYGKNAPMKPYENGTNVRHIKKPIKKEIEIN